jgi:hypothetical protein
MPGTKKIKQVNRNASTSLCRLVLCWAHLICNFGWKSLGSSHVSSKHVSPWAHVWLLKFPHVCGVPDCPNSKLSCFFFLSVKWSILCLNCDVLPQVFLSNASHFSSKSEFWVGENKYTPVSTVLYLCQVRIELPSNLRIRSFLLLWESGVESCFGNVGCSCTRKGRDR